jgi:hypothetical protein
MHPRDLRGMPTVIIQTHIQVCLSTIVQKRVQAVLNSSSTSDHKNDHASEKHTMSAIDGKKCNYSMTFKISHQNIKNYLLP